MNSRLKTARADTRVIAISGKSGCGNSTVSRLLAERLGRRLVNFTFKNLAEEAGMDFQELLSLARNDFSWDRRLDARQLAMTEEADCVLGSRLAIWLVENAELKVYLYADPEVRAGRIQRREGGRLEDILAFTHQRDLADSERFRQIYAMDNDQYQFADLIINTNRLDPEAIVSIIMAALPATRP